MDIKKASGNKMNFLEGIRGIMALNVVVNHFVVVFYPQMYFQNYAEILGGGLSLFASTPLSISVNGNIAVQYFFVLTGFLACRTVKIHNQMERRDVCIKIANRYLRLLPVVAFAVIFTFFTMVIGAQKHLEITNMVINETFYQGYCNFKPTIGSVIKDIFFGSFLKSSSYVGPFWTIKYEFLGYGICLLTSWLVYDCRWRRCIYLIVAFVCWSQLGEVYFSFFLGVLVADLWYTTSEKETVFQHLYERWIRSPFVLTLITCVGVYFACCPIYFSGIHKWLGNIPVTQSTAKIRGMGVALLLYIFLNFPKIQKCFSVMPLRWLGKISFEIYAMHWPIMLTLQAWLFGNFVVSMSYNKAAVLAFALSTFVTIGVSYIIWYLVERNRKYDIGLIIERTRCSN